MFIAEDKERKRTLFYALKLYRSCRKKISSLLVHGKRKHFLSLNSPTAGCIKVCWIAAPIFPMFQWWKQKAIFRNLIYMARREKRHFRSDSQDIILQGYTVILPRKFHTRLHSDSSKPEGTDKPPNGLSDSQRARDQPSEC